MENTLKYVVLCALVASVCDSSCSLQTLPDIVNYAERYPEEIFAHDASILSYDYTDMYEARAGRVTSWVRRMLYARFIPTDPLMDLQELVEQVAHQRVSRNMPSVAHVARVEHKPGDRWYVWSNIQGAFHSFVRGLQHIHEAGVIDDTLRIKDPHVRIVINGNLFGRAGFNAELLYVACVLMRQNPDQCIFIQGDYEYRGGWLDQGIIDQVRSMGLSPSFSDVRAAVERLFATLPIALFTSFMQNELGADVDKKDRKFCTLIRVSSVQETNLALQQRWFGDFFVKDFGVSGYLTHLLERQAKEPMHSSLRAAVKSFEGLSDYQTTEGLIEVAPENGAVAWSAFSGPSPVQQVMNKFTYDAYIALEFGNALDEALITLYHRNFGVEKPVWQQERSYQLTSGRAIDPATEAIALAKPRVLIGATFDLSKSAQSIGYQLREGILACLQARHAHDAPYDTHFIFFDDESLPRMSYASVMSLLHEYGVDTTSFTIGAAMFTNYIDRLKHGQTLSLFPVVGAPEFRSSDYEGIVYYRASFEAEVYALLDHAFQNATGKKMAFFYQDDQFGRGALEVARRYMRIKGISNWLELPYDRNSNDFSVVVQKVKTTSLDALFLFSLPIPTREFFQQLGIDSIYRIFQGDVYGLSLLGDDMFKSFIARTGLRMIVTHAVPNPMTSTLPIVVEYRAAMKQRKKPLGTFSLEAYIGASLILEAIRHTWPKFSGKEVRLWLESLQNYSFGGLALTFDKRTRDFGQSVWLEDPDLESWTEHRGHLSLF